MDMMMDEMVLGFGGVFVEGLADLLVVAQLLSLAFLIGVLGVSHHTHLFGTVFRRRGFRCPVMRREVEVEFLERWRLGVRCSTTPTRCSAFEAPTALACQRRCVDRSFRQGWEFAVPVTGRAEGR
jgi:hypothetical protein